MNVTQTHNFRRRNYQVIQLDYIVRTFKLILVDEQTETVQIPIKGPWRSLNVKDSMQTKMLTVKRSAGVAQEVNLKIHSGFEFLTSDIIRSAKQLLYFCS